MKLLFVDDEYEHMRNLCLSLDDYFGKEQVYKVKSAEKAMAFLEEYPLLIDLAIIDQKLQGKQTGLELGRDIAEKYPYIPLVMLTGYPDLERCTEAMQIGFSDFLNKSTDIINEAVLKKSLDRITSLSSVTGKIYFKQELKDARLRTKNLIIQLNKALLEQPYKSRRPRKKKTIPTMEEMFVFQERVLELSDKTGDEMDGDTLAIGMLVLETGQTLDTTTLAFIKQNKIEQSVTKFNFKSKQPRSTIQMRLQFFKNEIITDAGRLAHYLLKNNQEKFKLTIRNAGNKGHRQKGIETFVDDLVRNYL